MFVVCGQGVNRTWGSAERASIEASRVAVEDASARVSLSFAFTRKRTASMTLLSA